MKTVLFFIALFSAAIALCAVSDDDSHPEMRTVWDRIMHAQSYHNMSRGLSLLDDGKYSEAAREFGKAIVENPGEPWPHILLGSALYWAGQVDQAMTEFDAALKLDPKNADAWQLKGIAYSWKGNGAAALEAFSSAAGYAPARPDVQMNLGSIYESAGNFSEAVVHLRRAAELEPRHPLYWFQLGSLYSRLGRDTDAAEALNHALDIYSGYQDALVELGAVEERLGKSKAALSLFRKAVKLKPGDSVARLRAALLLDKAAARRDAEEIIAGAFNLMPSRTGEGIALSVSYSGAAAKGSSGQPDKSADSKTPAKPSPGGPVDSLRRNLERAPLDQQVHISVEMLYIPQPVLQQEKPGEAVKGALGRALNSQMQAQKHTPAALAAKRDFTLPPGDALARASEIDAIVDELNKAVAGVPPGADMRMALSMETRKPGAASAGPAQQDGGTPGQGRAPDDAASASRVVFNPRAVGNDMGLWVMGTAWLDLVNEVTPELEALAETETDPVKWEAAGLAHVIAGESRSALEDFARAESRGARETALMGSAVAWVLAGNEENAVDCLRKVLTLNPDNKTARENLKWLTTPSNIKGAK